MPNFGLSPQGFKRKRYADTLESMEARARSLFGENINLSERGPLGLFLRVVAWVLAITWQLAEKVWNSAFRDTAEGVSLDHVGKLIGTSRRLEERAIGEALFTGVEGATIESGTLVATEDDIEFRTTASVEIDSSQEVSVPVEAVEPGVSGNVPADTITVIVNPLPGIEEVTNPEATEGGRNRETDAEYRQRQDRSVSRGGSSTVESIEATLLDPEKVPGVRDALVRENDTEEEFEGIPPKSVAPLVFGGDNEDIAAAIFEVKAGGIRSFGDSVITVTDSRGRQHQIGFSRPDEVGIYVSITGLQTDTDFPGNGQDQIITEIISYIGGQDQDGATFTGLGLGQNVIYTKVIAAIQNVPGIIDFQLEIGKDSGDMQSSNVSIDSTEVAIIAPEDITITGGE